MATHFNFGPFSWDKFYHCILTSDSALLQLIDDLGLTSELQWTETKTGFFANDNLYSMSSALDFLRFPPLNLWQKARLALGILYASRIRDGRPLEKLLASEWLTKIFGAAELPQDVGAAIEVQAWRLPRRDVGGIHLDLHCAILLDARKRQPVRRNDWAMSMADIAPYSPAWSNEITDMGGSIVTNAPVDHLFAAPNGGIELTTAKGSFHFDQVIATIPSRRFLLTAPELAPIMRVS